MWEALWIIIWSIKSTQRERESQLVAIGASADESPPFVWSLAQAWANLGECYLLYQQQQCLHINSFTYIGVKRSMMFWCFDILWNLHRRFYLFVRAARNSRHVANPLNVWVMCMYEWELSMVDARACVCLLIFTSFLIKTLFFLSLLCLFRLDNCLC